MSGFAGFVTHRAVEAIGWGLVHSVWQLALLALAFAGVRLALRKRSPAARYALACITLGIMAVVPPATTWAVWSRVESSPKVAAARLAPSEPSVVASRAEPTDVMRHEPAVEATPPGDLRDSGDAATGSPEQPPSEAAMRVEPIIAPPVAPRWLATIREWLPWLVAGWLLGVAGFSARLACGFVGTRRLRREATSPVSAAIEDVLGPLAGRLGVRRAVRLVESALVEVPTLVGHLRPIILLPAAMLTGLTPRQLEAVLAHELAHVRRHDYLVNWIQTAIETVLFYHPAVWWVSREIRQERENCCDDLALSVCDDRIVYARALARVAELRSARYRSAVAETAVAATGGSLLDRIRRIVSPPAEGPTRRHAWLAGMLLLGVVLVATIGLMGVASDVAGDNGDGSENLQTELVFWHMIVDRVTAERIAGQTTPAADGMKRDVDIESSRLLETLRKAEADGTTIIPGGKMRWAQSHEWRSRDHFLDGLIDSKTLKDLEGSTVRGDYDTRWSGNFTLTRVDRAVQMKLDASMIARLEFYLLGTNERLEYELRKRDRNDEFAAHIEPGHARVWLRPMEQDGNADYCYVLVAQAAAVPKDLAEYVRSCNVTSRWIARGVEGALDDIRSALEWEKAAGPPADAATDSPACYTTPDGKRIEVVAIGRPARWPHRWWDMEGRPVQANPAWHKYAAGGTLALVVRRENQSDTVDFLIQTPSFNGSGSGSAGSSEFGPGESLHYLTDASTEGGLSKYLDEGGEVSLSVKHGTGDWTEIATIKEGQELKADGGRFALTKVDDRRSKRQPGLLGRIVGESKRPGLLLVDGKYDYDPAFEIQLAAIDAQGKRTVGPVTTGSGLFERDKDRWWFGHIQIDKADVDHFVIVKRPVVGHVFEKIPAKPEAAPDQADTDTPSEPLPEAGHENTDQSLPPRSISRRVTDADAEPIDPAEVRRKIAALAAPDQTVPMDEQPVPWLYQRRKQIMPQLIAALTDKNPTVAGQCLNILRDVPASKELTETLIAIAGDEQSPLRQEVLRRLEPSAADPRVARLLDQAGNDAKSFADPVTRARWSGLAGRKDRAVELLKPLLAEPGKSPWDTVQAIRLLGEMREPAGIDLLEPIAAGGDWGMAVEAYKALAQIDPRNHALTDDQRTLLDGARRYKETEEQLRRRIDGLAKLNPKETRPLVMQMLRDTDHAAQYPALLILTAWKDKDALPRILELVQGDNRSYHQQQAVAAYLSIDESPQAEKDVLDRLGTFGFGQSSYFEAVLRGIATADMPDDRKVAMLRAAGYNPQVPYAVPYAVGYMANRGHDVGGILVPLMLDEKNLQPMARYCTVAASDKARRFGPLVGRAMSLLMSEPTVAAGGEKTTVSTAEAATLILDAVAVYDLKESAADVQKLAHSQNAVIRNAAQAAGAKLGVPGTVNDLYAQLKSDDANVRRLAARSLLEIKPADESRRAEREAFVLSCLGTPSESHAMRVLTTCGGQKAVEALKPILDDPDAQRAVHAAWVLAQLPDEKAAAKALRRVAIFAMFHHQLYQQGAGIDFDIAPELRFHQVTQRLNPDPNAYSTGEGPVRIPNELLRPFDLDEAEQAYAVRCYQRAEGVHEIGRFTLHFVERIGRPGPAGYHPEGPTVLNQTYLPLLRAMAAGDPRLERLMVAGQNVAHFKYRQWAAQAIARITQEAASYTGLGGETLDSGEFPKPYADQDRLLARFFVDRLEQAKIPAKQPQSDREYRQQDYFDVTANQFCDQFGPGTIDAIRQEAGRRKISVERVLPRITTAESFDRVEVTIDGMWRGRRRLLIQGDGHQAVYSILARRPNEPVTEHTQTFQLGDDRRAELGRLLAACQSIGAETSPGATDIDQYTLTVTVGGVAREHRFHGFGKSPYADLAQFLASLDEQEYLYYRLAGDDAQHRLEAARQLYDDLSARMGHRSRTPSPRLDQIDYVRFEPIFTDWLVRYNDRKDDELSAAIAWVGYLKRKDLFMHVAALKDKGAQSDWDVLCETLVRLDDPRSMEILSELAGNPFRCEHAVFALIRSGKPGIEMLKKRLEEAVPPAYDDSPDVSPVFADSWPERLRRVVELWESNERIVRFLTDNWDRLEASSEIHASLAPVVARMIEARNRGRWSHHGMRTEYYEQYVRLPTMSAESRAELGKVRGSTPAESGPASPWIPNSGWNPTSR